MQVFKPTLLHLFVVIHAIFPRLYHKHFSTQRAIEAPEVKWIPPSEQARFGVTQDPMAAHGQELPRPGEVPDEAHTGVR